MTLFLYRYRYRATVIAVISNDSVSTSKYVHTTTVLPLLGITLPLRRIQSRVYWLKLPCKY